SAREITLPPALDAPSDSPVAPRSLPEAPETASSTPTSSVTATDSTLTNEPSSSPLADRPISRQPTSPPSARDRQTVTPTVSNQRPQTRQGDAPPQDAAEPSAQVRGAGASDDLDQLETEIDRLFVRANAVERGLDVLQQQQAGQGLGLRGDMASHQESMKLNLSRAQQAMEQRDGVRAQRFKTLAERDGEALEGFLGR